MRIIKHVRTISNKHDTPIDTYIVEYPRLIHSEMLTHRCFSRNSSSSRAIPTLRLSEIPDYIPKELYLNCKGMAGKDLATNLRAKLAIGIIKSMYLFTKIGTYLLNKINIHKQHTNRYIEPFKMIQVIITGTDWDNFFDLRISDNAQPEIHKLAKMMRDSGPKVVYSDIHLPFGMLVCPSVDMEDDADVVMNVALCARVSYGLKDGINYDTAKRIYSSLLKDGHMSPFEHVAYANDTTDCYAIDDYNYRIRPRKYANLTGWESYRNQLEVHHA